MRSNRAADAAAEFRMALSVDARNVESVVNLALVQKAAGRPTEARDLLRRAVAIDPRSAGSHYNLAVVADESGDRASAVEHYRAFLKYGSVTHGELVAPVRARLAALTG
jgi:tetratricopeptide (TPR) repeat protein